MAAAEVSQSFGSHPRSDLGHTREPWTIGWDEDDTRIRLQHIALAWVASRRSHDAYYHGPPMPGAPRWENTVALGLRSQQPKAVTLRPLRLFVTSLPKRHIASPADDDDDSSCDLDAPLTDPSDSSDALATENYNRDAAAHFDTPLPPRKPPTERIFADPAMAPAAVDWTSQDGFKTTAKKKTKAAAKAAAQSKWGDDDEEKKKEEGDGDAGGGDGGAGGGDAGDAGDAGSGDKKGSDDGDKKEDAPEEDDWGGFAPAKSKKKGKKGKAADPEPEPEPAKASAFDAFQEIKLDDGGTLDLSFDKPAATTGSGSGWDFSATDGAAATEEKKEEEGGDNPWSLNRGKPTTTKKKKGAFSFGFDEEETKEPEPEPPKEEKKEEDDGFSGFVSKKDKKKGKKGAVFAFEDPPAEEPVVVPEPGRRRLLRRMTGAIAEVIPEPVVEEPPKEEPKEEPVVEDSWGAVGKKKKKGKNVIEEIPKEPEPEPEPVKEEESSWGGGWGAVGKKDKKKGKG
ncbi:hypothetical protein VE04_07700, partial [Pseudogymnoascus sp. 24MN13]